MVPRYASLLAALLLASSLPPVLAGALTERWVVEEKAETRVILGPRRLEVCSEGPCREVVYVRSIASLERRAAAAPGGEERERLDAALDRMRFHRRKGLQILVPAVAATALFAMVALLLFLRLGTGLSAWARGSVRFLTCGFALGLVAFALVYADGVSYLPADGTQTAWGSSFYLLTGGCLLAFLGGLLAGAGPGQKPAPRSDDR